MYKDRTGEVLAVGDRVILEATVGSISEDGPVLGVVIDPVYTKADRKQLGVELSEQLNHHRVFTGPLTVNPHWLEKVAAGKRRTSKSAPAAEDQDLDA